MFYLMGHGLGDGWAMIADKRPSPIPAGVPWSTDHDHASHTGPGVQGVAQRRRWSVVEAHRSPGAATGTNPRRSATKAGARLARWDGGLEARAKTAQGTAMILLDWRILTGGGRPREDNI